MAEQQRNPNLMNPKAMQAVAGTRGAGENVLLFSEILTKVNNAKDKPKKIAVLRQHENAPLKQVLKGALTLVLYGIYQRVTHHILLMRHQLVLSMVY